MAVYQIAEKAMGKWFPFPERYDKKTAERLLKNQYQRYRPYATFKIQKVI
jgi:hypothetical protein